MLQTLCIMTQVSLYKVYIEKVDSGGHGGGTHTHFFAITSIFCNYFEELKTVLFEVELIINNVTLAYVYPNTIETCLTPNYLIFGR